MIHIFCFLALAAAVNYNPIEPRDNFHYHFRVDLQTDRQTQDPIFGSMLVYDYDEVEKRPGPLIRIYNITNRLHEVRGGMAQYGFLISKRTPRRMWIRIPAAFTEFCFSWHGFTHLSDATKIFRTSSEAWENPDKLYLYHPHGEIKKCATYDAFMSQVRQWEYRRQPTSVSGSVGPEYFMW